MDEFIKIVPNAFGPFIEHHSGLLCMYKEYSLKRVLGVLLHEKNYVNAE